MAARFGHLPSLSHVGGQFTYHVAQASGVAGLHNPSCAAILDQPRRAHRRGDDAQPAAGRFIGDLRTTFLVSGKDEQVARSVQRPYVLDMAKVPDLAVGTVTLHKRNQSRLNRSCKNKFSVDASSVPGGEQGRHPLAHVDQADKTSAKGLCWVGCRRTVSVEANSQPSQTTTTESAMSGSRAQPATSQLRRLPRKSNHGDPVPQSRRRPSHR